MELNQVNYNDFWQQIIEQNQKLNELYTSYWNTYSSFGNWQFWVIVASLILPLILLYFTVDRKRIFELFFFGYTIHMIWAYVDIALGRQTILTHTYFLLPMLPIATNITASLIPVGFILTYQYAINHKKNFYFLAFLVSILYSVVFAGIERAMGFVRFENGSMYLILILLDLIIVYFSYWFTRLIVKIKEQK